MGKQWKQCQTLFWGAPKSLQMVIAAMKLKDAYSFGRKVVTKLDSILKSRDITLSTNVHVGKAMVFPVVMYGCESWTVRKAERRRTDTFFFFTLQYSIGFAIHQHASATGAFFDCWLPAVFVLHPVPSSLPGPWFSHCLLFLLV